MRFFMGKPLAMSLVGIATGILAASHIVEPAIAVIIGLALLLPIALPLFHRIYWREIAQAIYTILFVLVVTGLAGWLSSFLGCYQLKGTDNQSVIIQARVTNYRMVSERLGHLTVRVMREWDGKGWQVQFGKILLLIKPGQESYHRGDVWLFGPLGLEKVPESAPNSSFKPARYWISKGVGYQAWLNKGKSKLIASREKMAVAEWFKRSQQQFSDRIAAMPLSQNCTALLSAMILGDRTDLNPEVRDEFSRAGIIHVLSVSGLHVGVIYLILKKLFSLLGFKRRRLPISLLSLILVWGFVELTGAGPSAVRAGGMITIFELAWLLKRNSNGLQVLGTAGFIHLTMNPFTLFSAGAQLSYLAVAGIFSWSSIFRKLKKVRFPLNKITGSISVSLSAQSLIVPPLIFWFGWFPVYFLAGNLFLVPIMITVFYLGILLFLLDLSGINLAFLYEVVDRLVEMAIAGASWMGSLPGNVLEPKGLSWIDVPLYYLVILLIRSYLQRPESRKLLGGLSLVLTAMIFHRFF